MLSSGEVDVSGGKLAPVFLQETVMLYYKSSFAVIVVRFIVIAIGFGMNSDVAGQEFRIETSVYAGDNQQPVAQNLTLFSQQMIYDFQMSNESQPTPLEIAIYDSRDKSFVLIDIKRNMRLDLEQSQLIKMLEGVRQQSLQNLKTEFLHAAFKEQLDVAGDAMTLSNDQIIYRVEGKPPEDVSVMPTYFDFLDQYTRLKASDPKAMPPFPRLKLNQSIKKLGWIPSRIEATYKVNELIKNEIKLQSTHTFIAELSKQDRKRIESAKTAWTSSTPVSLPKFRGLTVSQQESSPPPILKR